jgi:redox-sensitive bicupin YhaK (pirin superfamily)
MGNTEILKRGALQLTSAGTGVSHSEKAHGPKPVHFLQIWSIPHTQRLKPKYFTREFTDEQKTNTWLRVVAPVGADDMSLERNGQGAAPVQSALTMYATLLEKGKSLEKKLGGKKGYLQVVQTSGYNTSEASGATVRVSGVGDGRQEVVLKEGDSTYLTVGEGQGAELIVENVGDAIAEILLFDLE